MTLVLDITYKGSSEGQRVLLEDGDTLEVGRANETLNLSADPRLSRKHFVLRYVNREIEITHLSRTNPTLVASEGSSDFAEVTGRQVESRECRIIAGSHRFVVVVEGRETVIEPMLSGEAQAEIWSDVDSEEQGNQFFFDSFSEQNKPVGTSNADPSRTTMKDANLKPVVPATAITQVDSDDPNSVTTLRKPFFPSDNPLPKPPAPSTTPDSAEPEPPSVSKAPNRPASDKKIFFPIEDDFFD